MLAAGGASFSKAWGTEWRDAEPHRRLQQTMRERDARDAPEALALLAKRITEGGEAAEAAVAQDMGLLVSDIQQWHKIWVDAAHGPCLSDERRNRLSLSEVWRARS